MNVLVTSISKKIPLLRAVKKASERVSTNFKLIGADNNEQVIGRYFVDHFWKMPKLTRLSIDELIDYCEKNKVKAIIPSRDGELMFFAQYKDILQKNNISVMVSNKESIQYCIDKLLFYEYGKKLNYPVIKTSRTIELLDSHLFVVKEQFGAGSTSIGLKLTKEEAKKHATSLEKPIFQPFINGQEYSVDLYIAKDGRSKGVIVRSRDVVIHGESQVTTTRRFPELEQLAQKFACDFKLYGHVVLQVIEDDRGDFHIIECNSRFGGASTLSIAAGLDSFYWFLKEAQGEDVTMYPFHRLEKEQQLVRYPSDFIFEREEK